jgi:uncharacterized protein YcfL
MNCKALASAVILAAVMAAHRVVTYYGCSAHNNTDAIETQSGLMHLHRLILGI